MNFPGRYNKFMNNHASTTGGIKDSVGNYYYISHPPFAYILPHWVHKMVRVKPSVLSLQVFNLLINFISAIFIYLIICLLLKQAPFQKIIHAGLVGFIVYLFNPAVLWFQCNTYMSDMLVHLFFITSVYTLLQLLLNEKNYSLKQLFYFGFSLFLMSYTSWLGFLFALVVVAYALYKRKKNTLFKKLIATTTLTSVACLTLILFQYIRIAGFDEFVIQMLNRIGERGGPGAASTDYLLKVLNEVKIILTNYVTSYQALILLILILTIPLFKSSGRAGITNLLDKHFVLFSIAPILLLHVLLLNYSGHDFVSLYASLFLSVCIAVLYNQIENKILVPRKLMIGGIALTVAVSIGFYYFINRPGATSFNNENYAKSKEIAQYIKDHVAIDQVVFYTGEYPIYPEIVLYSKRNIQQVKDKREALDFMKAHDFNYAFWLQIDANGKMSHQNFYYENYLLDY